MEKADRYPDRLHLMLLLLHSAILLLCSLAAADMPLLLVFVQNGFNLVVKAFVCLFKLCGYILMNRAFADSELFCGTSYGSVVLHDIISENDASFFISFAVLLQ